MEAKNVVRVSGPIFLATYSDSFQHLCAKFHYYFYTLHNLFHAVRKHILVPNLPAIKHLTSATSCMMDKETSKMSSGVN